MIFLWILGVLLGLLVLLCLLRIGAVVDYDEKLTVRISVGPFRFQVVPSKKPEKEKKAKPKKKHKKTLTKYLT